MPNANDYDLLPVELLATQDMIQACAERDLGVIFRIARDDIGFTLSKLARLCEMTPSRVSDYVNGRARVRQQHVVERVSHGLRIPGEMLGLAPQPWEEGQPVPALGRGRLRGSAGGGLGSPASGASAGAVDRGVGDVVELSLAIDIEVRPEGDVRLVYRQVVLNLTGRPLTRVVREMWFEHTRGGLHIAPTNACDRQIAIQRLYETPGLTKFACQISPPVPPGETTVIEYVCEGGIFLDATYWRQTMARHTQFYSVDVTHYGIAEFRGCTAVEEYPDGSESSVAQSTRWSLEDSVLKLALTREDLHVNQYVTLHWDVVRAPA